MTMTAPLGVFLMASLCLTAPADSSRKALVDSWQGRRVVVTRTLYSLVYNEHGRLGKTYRGKQEGLTVVAPAAGTFFRFEGRDSEGDISGRNPQEVLDQTKGRYAPMQSTTGGFSGSNR